MARRRSSRRRSYRRRAISSFRRIRRPSMGGMKKTIPFIVGAVTGIQQIAEKDIEASGATFDGYDATTKLKFIMNSAIARITGYNPFPELAKYPQQINPAGILNKWTGLGVVFSWLYPMIPKAPGKAILRKVGAGMLGGGIVGGLFDPTPQQQAAYRQNVYTQPNTASVWR